MVRRSKIDGSAANVVSDCNAFGKVCDHLSAVKRFAFDAEFIAEDGYNAEVCLMQIATEGQLWLVDPLAGFDVRRLWCLVNDPDIETVVHAGQEDLALCYQHTGQVPRNVFDIQIAAGLVGFDYPLSLQRLARMTVGARLHKSQTLTDWRKRPLTDRQIQYALEDVRYLLRIHDTLDRRLKAMKRTEWAKEEFARFSDVGTYNRKMRDPLWRVRGLGSLDAKGLAVAKELAIEREELAKQYDRPPRTLLKDHLLAMIAKHGWTRQEDLTSLRGLTLRGQALRRMAAAVQRGLDTPLEACPRPTVTEEDTPQEVAMCKLISAVLYDYCRRHQIAFQLTGTNKDIRALVLTNTRGSKSVKPRALQRGWRQRQVGGLIQNILDGRQSIQVARGKDGLYLQFN